MSASLTPHASDDRGVDHGRARGGGSASLLPLPAPGRWAAEDFVLRRLGHLADRRGDDVAVSSSVFRGGRAAAEATLRRFSVAGYRAGTSTAYPQPRRTTSALSPWVRHGLLSLQRLWDHVEGGPPEDVEAFRRRLLHQEFARHRYARIGRAAAADADTGPEIPVGERWQRTMGCVEITLDELEEDGWITDESRRWAATAFKRQHGPVSTTGEDHFFRHLLDGSRAVNGIGWEQAADYRFTRWEVEERAAGLCATCDLVRSCPIERLSPTEAGGPTRGAQVIAATSGLQDHDSDLDRTAGPGSPVVVGDPEAVWLTAESMGDDDPALAAHPDLPAIFVFDEPLLNRLRLSTKRMVFMVETLSELADRRPVELHLGDPVEVLTGRRLAATFTAVPGWRRRATRLDIAALHPWPWLLAPHDGPVGNFEGWIEAADIPNPLQKSETSTGRNGTAVVYR